MKKLLSFLLAFILILPTAAFTTLYLPAFAEEDDTAEPADTVVYGDVNKDGSVNKKDSLALKKYLADDSNPCDLTAADVNNDGSVNKKDSLRLKQWLAGWEVQLGPDKETDTDTDTDDDADADADSDSDGDVEVPKTITASIIPRSGAYEITGTGEGSVTVTASAAPAAFDKVTATIEGHYLRVSARGQTSSPILYLPDGVFTYTFRSNCSVYMSSDFSNKPLSFTFSIPTDEELAEDRDLALNPYDYYLPATPASYPHAETNNVYDTSGQFIARNAIDGYSSNAYHGNYPYESWGPKATVLASDYFTIDFGREVSLSALELYLRADGFGGGNSHDAYFSSITVEFSDGTSVTVSPTKVAAKQTFTFTETTTTYIKLTGFVTDKSNSQGWAAITEINAIGHDIV